MFCVVHRNIVKKNILLSLESPLGSDALRVREQNEGESLLSARLLVPGDSDLLQGPGIKEQLVENPVINLLRETCVYILTRNPYFALVPGRRILIPYPA